MFWPAAAQIEGILNIHANVTFHREKDFGLGEAVQQRQPAAPSGMLVSCFFWQLAQATLRGALRTPRCTVSS